MNRIKCRIVRGFLAAAIGFAPVGFAAAADTNDKTGQVRTKSPATPSVARVVVTPGPEQMAKIRLERCMIGLENRATAGQRAGSGHTAATTAL